LTVEVISPYHRARIDSRIIGMMQMHVTRFLMRKYLRTIDLAMMKLKISIDHCQYVRGKSRRAQSCS